MIKDNIISYDLVCLNFKMIYPDLPRSKNILLGIIHLFQDEWLRSAPPLTEKRMSRRPVTSASISSEPIGLMK